MKSVKVLCALGLFALFLSCTSQEEAVTFFIENQLNEQLIIERLSDENTQNQTIHSQVPLDLRSSETFNKYIQRLRDLEVRSLTIQFSNYQGQIQNGRLYLEDIFLGDFEAGIHEIWIRDLQTTKRIETLFLERTELNFSFVGESYTEHFLSVQIRMSIEGTFVH